MSTLRLHPDDPRRLVWHDRAHFLLGATEHYGAVLNTAFDYEPYLDTIAAAGLTLTRAFAFFREREASLGGRLGYANTLAPRPEEYLAPWGRAAGGDRGPDGLPKFDLDTWDERYFARLRALLAAAARRGIVVELTLFCRTESQEDAVLFPLHPASNVNGIGTRATWPRDFRSLRDPGLVEHQRRLVRKIAAETNDVDNLYFEICNEPLYYTDARPAGAQPEVLRQWQRVLIDTLREAERPLPKRHLVAVNSHMELLVREDEEHPERRIVMLDDGFYRNDPEVDLINVHYLSQRETRASLQHVFYLGGWFRQVYRFGNVASFVAARAPARKAYGFDETYWGILDHLPPPVRQNRMEAWESLLGGCAVYDHLDMSFTPQDPTGSGDGQLPPGVPRAWLDGRPLRRYLEHVARYAVELDLATLRPEPLAIAQTPSGVGAVAARSVGRQGPVLSVYLADLRRFDAGYGTTPLAGVLWLASEWLQGHCSVRALEPRTGMWTQLPPVPYPAARQLRIDLPPFTEDLLLHLEFTGA